ncbi:microsomal glutathione S-transferase 1-like [Anopheles bellator]|uniref:microsomal glutathione S-transferase 1-like n=1 Tax=Anopheles bellator TaxID=139047 RepID=UPI002649E11B|nr:microsomal glutathione S-transferase 1-like [Anopheles bellator]
MSSNLFGQVDPAIVQAYASCVAILGLKMLTMSLLTGLQRGKKKVFSNPEDVRPGGKVAYNDPDVERVRRAHRNDMENILPFFAVGFLYMFTGPSVTVAVNLFRLVAAARVGHTICHALVPIGKVRGLCFGIGLFTTVYMAVQVLCNFRMV